MFKTVGFKGAKKTGGRGVNTDSHPFFIICLISGLKNHAARDRLTDGRDRHRMTNFCCRCRNCCRCCCDPMSRNRRRCGPKNRSSICCRRCRCCGSGGFRCRRNATGGRRTTGGSVLRRHCRANARGVLRCGGIHRRDARVAFPPCADVLPAVLPGGGSVWLLLSADWPLCPGAVRWKDAVFLPAVPFRERGRYS